MKQATLTRENAAGKETYLAAFDRLNERLGQSEPHWLARLRNVAAESFRRQSFPTIHDEDWKYTNVAPIVRTPFATPFDPPSISITAEELERLVPSGGAEGRLVFVDGCCMPELSKPPRGAVAVSFAASVSPLAELTDHNDLIEAHLGRYASINESAFSALNTALIHDGALVFVPAGVVLDAPINLVFVSTSAAGPTASHPRVLVVLGRASSAVVTETYIALDDGPHFTNVVAEIVLGEGAILDHSRIVDERAAAYHLELTEVALDRDSTYRSFSMNVGAAIGRNDLHVRLGAPGASCTLDGVSVTQGTEHVDNHTLIDHAEPHGTSRQLYKCVLDDASRTVFNGKVIVRPHAQKTDAQQANRNLLLSPLATLDTKPQLEILADDVKCSHGATVGQLDEDMVFYLKSRGLDEEASRGILTYAFARDVVESVRDPHVRTYVDRLLAARLSGGAPDGLTEPWSGR